MGEHIKIDFSDAKAFFASCRAAGRGDFEKALRTFLEGLGFEFLRIVQDEIIRRKVVDTRLLLNSFHKGEQNNIWTLDDGGLRLTVGTNVEYASYVNDGHWTVEKGKIGRFVPGIWQGDRFVYQPGAKTGMYLKQQWIEGSHYWESALRIIDRVFPELLDVKLQQWLDTYFKDFI